MIDSGVGLRELKKQMTRESIALAALTLAAEKGIDQVTIEEIARIAFVSPRTFSNYFSCKEEAVMAAGQPTGAAIQAAVAARPRDEQPLRSLRHVLVESLASMPREQLNLYRRKLQLVDEHPTLRPFQMAEYASLEENLRIVLLERRPDDSAELLLSLIAGTAVVAVRTAMRLWAADNATHSRLGDLIEGAFEQIQAGLDVA